MMRVLRYVSGVIWVVWASACGGSEPLPPTGGSSVSSPSAEETVKHVVYLDAVVYAASTYYYFQRASGDTLAVNVLNLPEERVVKLPDDMLEDLSEEQEGPPGPNPARVGKPCRLIYSADGELREISF